MKSSHITSKTFFYLLFYLISIPATALSTMGNAVITIADGKPCFSIEENSETKHGLPLQSLRISELLNQNSTEPPSSVWNFRATDYEAPPMIFPRQCIRYGENTAGATQRELIPLELFKVYYVSISAKNDVSNVFAYTGRFCIKPGESGEILVHRISEDRRLGDTRFAGCRK